MNETPVVKVKRGYADLLPKFLFNRQHDIELMKTALLIADFPAIRSTAHRVKGAGAAYGFDQLTIWGMELETLCAQCDASGIECVLDKMRQYLASARIEIV